MGCALCGGVTSESPQRRGLVRLYWGRLTAVVLDYFLQCRLFHLRPHCPHLRRAQ